MNKRLSGEGSRLWFIDVNHQENGTFFQSIRRIVFAAYKEKIMGSNGIRARIILANHMFRETTDKYHLSPQI